jgi:hypothetical protein
MITSKGLSAGWIDILGTLQSSEDAVLEFSGFFCFQVEVCAWVPVAAFSGIVVGNTAVGIVEGAFQSLAWTVFLVVLENNIRHSLLLVAVYACIITPFNPVVNRFL